MPLTEINPQHPIGGPEPHSAIRNLQSAIASTGPRLPTGKAVSSANAAKHGIFARDRFIERGHGAEDPADFREVLAELRRIYRPEGPRQDHLVEHIADCQWRLLRLRRFEIGAIHSRVDAAAQPSALERVYLREHIADCRRRIATCRETLAAVRENPQAGLRHLEPLRRIAAQQILITGPKLMPGELFRLANTWAERSPSAAQHVRDELLETLHRLIKRDQANLAQLRAQLQHAAREPALRAERERRLYAIPEPHDTHVLIRYERMLTRDRDRAIKELDRLKDWGE